MSAHLLTILILMPLGGALAIAFLDPRAHRGARQVALLTTLATFAVSLLLWTGFDPTRTGYQFVENVSWIPSLGVGYHVGVDGISFSLILLTTFLTPIALLSSWRSVEERVRAFTISILFLEAAMIGVFVALDLVLFYVFWEAMLIPMFLIIGVWGGERRIYAAVKFFLYTAAGSLLMLLAILYIHIRAGATTFDLEAILPILWSTLTPTEQIWLFLAFGISFAIKVPMFPLHTWLPDAHVQAPTAGSVILAGVLLKMGGYGFLRFALPLFPHAAVVLAPYVAVLALAGIVWGSLMALAQTDIKKLIAYSSVAHLGFVMLGIASLTPAGVAGGVFQMVAHGLSTGALFFLVGVIYERRHTRDMDAFGGLATSAPGFATVFLFITLASIGLPGLCGFVGEVLCLAGAFSTEPIWAAVGGLGIVLGAVYMLRLYQRVVFGRPARAQAPAFPDLDVREWLGLLPLGVAALVFGVAPGPILSRIVPETDRLVNLVMGLAQR